MNPRIVIESCLAALALAFQGTGDQNQDTPQAFFLPEGESRVPELRNDLIGAVLLSAKDTNGAVSIFGGTARANPPLHIHHHQDEWLYVLEGEMFVQVGDQKFHAKRGDCAFGPRGVPHSFATLSDPCSFMSLFRPAGTMEEFFIQVMKLLAQGGRPSQEALVALSRAHGMEIVGPPPTL
jgi:mannose-6-phosphate isomerase-like protein (cupin superfamily)